MSVRKFASDLKAQIETMKSQGTTSIYCDTLISYLDKVGNSPEPTTSEIEMEQYKADLQKLVDENKYIYDSGIEMFKAVIAMGQNALRSGFLLNGGAAVALLAFISRLTETNPGKVEIFAHSLIFFVAGVFAVVLTSGMSYLSQWFYHQFPSGKTGLIVNIICIILGLSSLGLFIWGSYKSYTGFLSFS